MTWWDNVLETLEYLKQLSEYSSEGDDYDEIGFGWYCEHLHAYEENLTCMKKKENDDDSDNVQIITNPSNKKKGKFSKKKHLELTLNWNNFGYQIWNLIKF